MQIAPVFTRRQLVFSVEAEQLADTADGQPDEYRLIFHVDPVVTLWNPYNVALEFSELESGFTWMDLTANITIHPPDAPSQTIRSGLYYLGGLVKQGNRNFMSLKTRLNASGKRNPGEGNDTMRMEPGELIVFSNIEGESDVDLFPGAWLKALYLGPGLGDGANTIELSESFSSRRLDTDNVLGRNGEIIVPEDTGIQIQLEGSTARRSVKTRIKLTGVSNHDSMFGRLYFDDSSVERPDLSWKIQDLRHVAGAPRKTPVAALQIQRKAENAEDPMPMLAHTNPFATSVAPLTGDAGYPEKSPDAFEMKLRKITSWKNDLVSIAPDSPRGFWGASHDFSGNNFIPVVELPVAPLLSVASLQNVHVAKLPHHPAFAVAGSHASPYIPRDQVRHALETNRGTQTQIDYSYLMNEALFDRYFFSSLAPRPGAPDSPSLEDVLDDALANPEGRLPNTRMRLIPGEDETNADLRDKLVDSDGSPTAEAYRRIAENLLIDGAFNVNSTSVEAWKAVLAGTNGTDVVYQGGGQPDADSPLTRYRVPPGPPDEEWRGFNTLSPDQIQALAEAIVREVKTRYAQNGNAPAPFFGIADFVNRALATNETGLKGAVQAAIDRTDINDGFSKGYRAEERTNLGETEFIHPEALHGPVAVDAPGYFSQRDLLVPLGPTLAARSDTFRIRARGARTNPATGGEETEAWVEMIVQRVPEKVNSGEDIQSPGPDGGFGRRFEIVDFRWLSSADI